MAILTNSHDCNDTESLVLDECDQFKILYFFTKAWKFKKQDTVLSLA